MLKSALHAVLLSTPTLSVHPSVSGPSIAEQTKPSVANIALHVIEAAQRFGMPERWIYAVIRAESAGKLRAVSSAGALGLMQLMPGTWARQRSRLGLGNDPFDPRDNIMAGVSYLREMYDSYGAPGFLAAYNAGPGRYEDWRDRGRSLPAETQAYVAKIASMLHYGNAAASIASAPFVQTVRPLWTQSPLFSVRSEAETLAATKNATQGSREQAKVSLTPPESIFAPVSQNRR